MPNGFNQSEYWIDRHKRLVGDPRSVGHLGASIEQNHAGEAALMRTVAEAAVLLQPARTVLDVGCGYGRVAKCFTDNGYDYLGVDISPEAVRQARERNDAAARFVVGNLATWDTHDRFDLVTIFYVLVHFVDENSWRSLLERALSWVAPGGALLLADHFPSERQAPVVHVVSRPFATYEAVFATQGFVVDDDFAGRLIGMSAPTSPAKHFRLARRL